MRVLFPTQPTVGHHCRDVPAGVIAEVEEVRRARAEHERAQVRERVFTRQQRVGRLSAVERGSVRA